MIFKKFIVVILLIFISASSGSAQFTMQSLGKYAGEWKVTITMWMEPTQPPMSSEVTVHSELIMNGLFMTSHYHGPVMGMEYDAISTLGYNTIEGKFKSTWIDNMSADILYAEGKSDDNGKTIELHASYFNPATGKVMQTIQRYTLVDDTHQRIEKFDVIDGKEVKSLQYDFTKS